MRVENNKFTIGGNIESALKGEYQLDVKEILQEGWMLTKQGKSIILQGLLLVFSIGIATFTFIFHWLGIQNLDEISPGFRMLIDLSFTILLSPFLAALVMIGISNSIRAVSKPAFIFHFIPKTLILSLAAILVSAIVQLGFILFIIPGIYLLVATSFTIPLVLDKGLTPAKAMITSVKVTTFNWFDFAKIFGFFALLSILCLVTFGVALFWVAPYYYNVKGILYRDVFGVEVNVMPLDREKLQSDNIFHA